MVGGIGAGTAADRWGRKRPLMFSILWYSVFAGLGGFSTSYTMLFACRALFGIGMGGVWAAGMPLALEHWPSRLRGLASGLLQGGYPMGFILSSLVYQFGYPFVRAQTDEPWRVMLFLGVLPALMVFWIGRRVHGKPGLAGAPGARAGNSAMRSRSRGSSTPVCGGRRCTRRS